MASIYTVHSDRYEFLKEHSRYNRKFQTYAEEKLWNCLRGKSLGVKFRRQHCIGDCIVDFVSLDKKLVIEVDGEHHNTAVQRLEDDARTDSLNRYGFYVLRFTNEMVMNDIDYVLDRIKELLNQL